MKKFLVVLLSLGLIAAFSMPAAAADVKFGGVYYIAGVYDNNPTLAKEGYSQAWFNQRVRINTVFQVAEGLKFTTQFDALEKQWGDNAWRRGANSLSGDGTSSRPSYGSPTSGTDRRLVQENFEFEQSYLTFNTKAGVAQIGYQTGNVWGTAFGNYPGTVARAMLTSKFGSFITMAIYEKAQESTVTNLGYADADQDSYALAGIYKGKGMETGVLLKYYVDKGPRTLASAYTSKYYLISPYMKAAFGPVNVEWEVGYLGGKAKEFETGGTDVDMASWNAYINGSMKFGPAKVGAQFGYITGNDFSSDKSKGSLPGGYGWNPTLMLMNGDMKNWGGNYGWNHNYRDYLYGAPGSNGLSDMKYNSIWYQVYGNYTMTPKLGFTASVTYATVQTKKLSATREAISDKLGWEVDMTATYKLFDNLSYMVGAGYLFAGDYFKLDNAAAEVENNYILINKLTLSF